jgi:hypothetical protein
MQAMAGPVPAIRRPRGAASFIATENTTGVPPTLGLAAVGTAGGDVDAATAALLLALQYRDLTARDYDLLGRLDAAAQPPRLPESRCVATAVGP